jgi:glycosyltransferase involved in cell wall biosynthesis
MDSLYIVMPAYNEEANIDKTVNTWYSILDGKDEASRLVVADSGSSDSTHQILLNLQNQYPKLVILEHTEKQHGPKVIALYDYAVKNYIDYIFQTDSDGQTNPDEFEQFWKLRKKYDGIFGYRPVRGDGKIRAFVEKVVCALLRLYFGVKVPDANAPFRLMKSEVVKNYLYNMKPDYNLPNIMMTTYFVYYHEKCRFIPISFKPRQGGKNSVNLAKIIKIGWNALKDFRELKQKM